MGRGSRSVYTTLGASNHTQHERTDNDFYATDPVALELLLEEESFAHRIWECACGAGHLSRVLEKHGYDVTSTDLIYRGFGRGGVDFLATSDKFDGDIITNPPYSLAKEFVEHSLDLIGVGNKVAMFLRLLFLEGKGRRQLFDLYPPRTVYVASGRLKCAIAGDFDAPNTGAMALAWFVWEKGFYGDTVIKWIN